MSKILSELKLPCKVRIKSIEEIERTLDEYSNHKSDGLYFSHSMILYCGRIINLMSKHDSHYYGDSWAWHPDWFTVLDDSLFTEEDDAIIEELTQMLEHHLEMQELRETVELLHYFNKKEVKLWEEVNFLEGSNARLEEAIISHLEANEKLQKENEELKKQVELAKNQEYHALTNPWRRKYGEVKSENEELKEEIKKLQRQLKIQTKRVENLKKSNEFYADSKNWIQDTADCMGFTYRRRISNDDVSVEEVWMQEYMDNRYFGGKNAWEAKFKDQELQKKMEEVK